MKTIGLIFLENLLEINRFYLFIFVLLFSFHPIKGQYQNIKYDSLTQKNVYAFVEKMPQYMGGEVVFMNDFSKNFEFNFTENEEKSFQTILRVQFVIDTIGCLIGARIYNNELSKLTSFEKAGLRALNLLQNWQPGEHNGKSVNVLMTKIIHIDGNFSDTDTSSYK